MRILYFGFKSPNHLSSFIANGFIELGYELTWIDTTTLVFTDTDKISAFYTDEDFVYIFHINTKSLINDVNVPVIYYHFEMLWRPCVDKCDVLIMASPLIENFLVLYYPKLLYNNPAKYIQYYGVDLERFDSIGKKKYLKCSFMGKLEWEEKCWIEKDMYKTRKRVVEECSEYLDLMPHDDYEEYINNLKHSQSTLIVHGKNCYISQRIFEAAAASVCPIIYVDDEIGAQIYEDIGLKNHQNCIFLVDSILPESIKNNAYKFSILGQNARKWVEKRNNINNCKEIIKYVEQYKKNSEKSKKQRSLRATRLIESQL